MLTADELIPFLEHEDYLVRRQAVQNLQRGVDKGSATADDLWRSIDKFGIEKSVPFLAALPHLPQTESSYQSLMAAMGKSVDRARQFLEDALAAVSWDLLVKHHEEILALNPLPKQIAQHFSRRLKRDGASFGKLWKRLKIHARKNDPEALSEFSERSRGRLFEVMVRRYPAEAAAHAMAQLGKKHPDSWMETFSCELLGELRHRPAAPLLFERVKDDETEALASASNDALAKMADPEIVQEFESVYREVEWGARLEISEVLKHIRIPECEAMLLRLIDFEKDADALTFLASSLCDLCPTRESLEKIYGMIPEDVFETDVANIKAQLVISGMMVGYTPPEFEAWKKEADLEEASTLRIVERMNRNRLRHSLEQSGP